MTEEGRSIRAECGVRSAECGVRPIRNPKSEIRKRLLPAPLTEALDRTSAAFARMPAAERRLAEELVGADPVLFVVRTASRVDVGRWRGQAHLWAFALRHELAILAHGPRPYAERIPFSRLRESTYNPVTGELVLAPAPHRPSAGSGRPELVEGRRVRGLRMPPLDGYQMLAQILADSAKE